MYLLEFLQSYRKLPPHMECFMKVQVIECRAHDNLCIIPLFSCLCCPRQHPGTLVNYEDLLVVQMKTFSCMYCHFFGPLMSFNLGPLFIALAGLSSSREATLYCSGRKETYLHHHLALGLLLQQIYSTRLHIPLAAPLTIPSHRCAAAPTEHTLGCVRTTFYTRICIWGTCVKAV